MSDSEAMAGTTGASLCVGASLCIPDWTGLGFAVGPLMTVWSERGLSTHDFCGCTAAGCKASRTNRAVLVESFSRVFQSSLSVAPHSREGLSSVDLSVLPSKAAMPRGKDNEKTELCILHSTGGVAAVSTLP